MSFQALIIPEDATYNGYILKPLVKRLLRECGRPNAFVTVLNNPRVQGYEHVKGLMNDILERYRHKDLLLFLPDADGKDRQNEFTTLESRAAAIGAPLICCAAIQEVETWLLAGHRQHLTETWDQVRGNPRVKEEVFRPFLQNHGNPDAAGEGREKLMTITLQNFEALLRFCPELSLLKARVESRIETTR